MRPVATRANFSAASMASEPVLLRNDQALGNAWVRLQLVGKTAPRDGQGASVRLKAGGRDQWRHVASTRGYLSSSETILTFGIGKAVAVDEVEVTWPGGRKQSVLGVAPGKLTVIAEDGAGNGVPTGAPPR